MGPLWDALGDCVLYPAYLAAPAAPHSSNFLSDLHLVALAECKRTSVAVFKHMLATGEVVDQGGHASDAASPIILTAVQVHADANEVRSHFERCQTGLLPPPHPHPERKRPRLGTAVSATRMLRSTGALSPSSQRFALLGSSPASTSPLPSGSAARAEVCGPAPPVLPMPCPCTATCSSRSCTGQPNQEAAASAVAARAPGTDTGASSAPSPREAVSDSNSELSEVCTGSEQSDVDHLTCDAKSRHASLDVVLEAATASSTLLRQDPTLPPPFDPADTSRRGSGGQRQRRAVDGGPVVTYVADAARLGQRKGRSPAIACPQTLGRRHAGAMEWTLAGQFFPAHAGLAGGWPRRHGAWRGSADAERRRRAAAASTADVADRRAVSMAVCLAGMVRRVEQQRVKCSPC